MFMPGQSPLLSALLDRSGQNNIYVRGVVSTIMPTQNGDIVAVGGQVVKSGAPAQSFHDNVQLPAGVSAKDHPSWEETEFNVQEIHAAHLMAIVHSKTIVIDPFSDQCAVITGSHNFSDSASQKNDENLVIVRGNKKLAQAYALHINGVYDHYSWRAFLASGGDADQIYKPLDGWKPGGSRAQELEFWMNEPIAPQSTRQGASPGPAKQKAGPAAKPKAGKAPRKSKAARATRAKGAKKSAKKTTKKTTKKPAKKPGKKATASKRAAKAKAKRKPVGRR
jgi:PLD-like domain